ncbi:hypothetical protein GFS24_00225 [Chitinophaga sp. SYP-B3965]|uniref:hypothetical protein n=1 Tax=Chitinophaga sp. SYP-B3965 TaxID=2663120 RepID=UPI001299D524|nr:hypothetical protein [Chitinophaga sp. SYP-B3965]MRG43514.1 hypothetical protein [Chitinophaga sp. SYP-B3965]
MKYTYLLVLLILAAGCLKTKEFYDQLEGLPRANQLENNAYAVGDTLVLTGKFGAGKADLKITVGGIDAPVISLTSRDSSYTQNEVLYNYTLDVVKVLITTPMIGPQQPVIAKVNGMASTVAIILVTKDKPVAVRNDTLNYLNPAQASVVLSMPLGTKVVPNYTPGGPIVFINGDSVITWQEGAIRRGKTTWMDDFGIFSIVQPANINYGFAVDPAGDYLYISCITMEEQLAGTGTAAARFLKMSLHDYSVTTLNRTLLPTESFFISDLFVDLEKVKKEGPLKDLFLPVMKNLYINKAGEIYFAGSVINWLVYDPEVYGEANNLTVGRIDASGDLKYLAKGNSYPDKICQVRYIKNEELLETYDFLPHITNVINYTKIHSIDPENKLLYAFDGADYAGAGGSLYDITAFNCYSLEQQRQLSSFAFKQVTNGSPTITDGPFNVLEGLYREFQLTGTRVYQWPSPGQPMVMFAYQQQYEESGNYDYVWNGSSKFINYERTSVKVIDFSKRSVSTYAPVIRATIAGTVDDNPQNPGYAFEQKYRLGIGGDVIGYTMSKLPLMIRNYEIDATLNEVLLLAPVQ